MTTACLIMDIDGVLIPYPDAAGRSPSTHTRHLVTPTGYERQPAVAVWLNHAHGQVITKFLAETGLSMVWATSWQHDANRLIGSRLGVPVSTVIEWDRVGSADDHRQPSQRVPVETRSGRRVDRRRAGGVDRRRLHRSRPFMGRRADAVRNPDAPRPT